MSMYIIYLITHTITVGDELGEKEKKTHVSVPPSAFRQFRDNSENIDFSLSVFVNSRLRIL